MLSKIKQNNSGVTLLEMVVAVALFSVVVLSATEIFRIAIKSQHYAISAQNTQENTMYALEVMAKEVRMAQKVDGSDCTGLYNILDNRIYYVPSSGELRFKNFNNECVKYFLDDSRLKIGRNGVEGYITPDEIAISNLQFNIVDDLANNKQSKVTIKMDVKAVGKQEYEQVIKVQTTISSRYYE